MNLEQELQESEEGGYCPISMKIVNSFNTIFLTDRIAKQVISS